MADTTTISDEEGASLWEMTRLIGQDAADAKPAHIRGRDIPRRTAWVVGLSTVAALPVVFVVALAVNPWLGLVLGVLIVATGWILFDTRMRSGLKNRPYEALINRYRAPLGVITLAGAPVDYARYGVITVQETGWVDVGDKGIGPTAAGERIDTTGLFGGAPDPRPELQQMPTIPQNRDAMFHPVDHVDAGMFTVDEFDVDEFGVDEDGMGPLEAGHRDGGSHATATRITHDITPIHHTPDTAGLFQ